MALNEIRVEGVHRLAVLPEEMHYSGESVLLVVRIDGEIRARIELLPRAFTANEGLRAVVD
jgi:hypothetical protein